MKERMYYCRLRKPEYEKASLGVMDCSGLGRTKSGFIGIAESLKEKLERANVYTLWFEEIDISDKPFDEDFTPKLQISLDKEDLNDAINPKHYTSHPSGIECIEITKHYDFCVGNAIKYLWRAGLKQDQGKSNVEKEIEDLKKANWYILQKIKDLSSK